MPVTPAKERMRKSRMKQKARKVFTQEAADKIRREGLDVNVSVKFTDYGTVKIDWDMSVDTNALLEAYCESQGYALDDLLQDLQVEMLAKVVKDAKAKTGSPGRMGTGTSG